MEIRNTALVIRRLPYRETSLIIWLFTRDYGMINGMARGIRRSRQPERALFAGLHTLDLRFRVRSPEAMAQLLGAEMVRGRHRLPSDPMAMAGVQLLFEVVYRYVPPHDPQPLLFDRLEAALNALEAGADTLREIAMTMVTFLTLLGFGWRVELCAGCGGQEALRFFSIRRGMPVCQACGAPYARRLISLTPELWQLLRPLVAEATMPMADPRTLGDLYRLGMDALLWHGGRPLVADAHFRLLLGLDVSEKQSLAIN